MEITKDENGDDIAIETIESKQIYKKTSLIKEIARLQAILNEFPE